jgi:hypothetical protein
MTEEQIERRVERAMDRLDARLMSGRLSQAEYDREVVALDKWALQQARYVDAIQVDWRD